MTTTIPALDFYLAGIITATLLACTYAARQWIVRRLGRAKPLPDAPQGDEASAPEGGVFIGQHEFAAPEDGQWPCCNLCGMYWSRRCQMCRDIGWKDPPRFTPMQGSHAPDPWPMHFHGDKLPRRKGA